MRYSALAVAFVTLTNTISTSAAPVASRQGPALSRRNFESGALEELAEKAAADLAENSRTVDDLLSDLEKATKDRPDGWSDLPEKFKGTKAEEIFGGRGAAAPAEVLELATKDQQESIKKIWGKLSSAEQVQLRQALAEGNPGAFSKWWLGLSPASQVGVVLAGVGTVAGLGVGAGFLIYDLAIKDDGKNDDKTKSATPPSWAVQQPGQSDKEFAEQAIANLNTAATATVKESEANVDFTNLLD